MNTALLEKAKQSIVDDLAFDMDDWDHCICGHVAKVLGVQARPYTRIADALNITWDQAGDLFLDSHWPEKYRTPLRLDDQRNACDLIDHFIACNGEMPDKSDSKTSIHLSSVPQMPLSFWTLRRQPIQQFTAAFTNMIARVYPTPVVVPPPTIPEPTPADIAAIDSFLAEANVEEEVCELV